MDEFIFAADELPDQGLEVMLSDERVCAGEPFEGYYLCSTMVGNKLWLTNQGTFYNIQYWKPMT